MPQPPKASPTNSIFASLPCSGKKAVTTSCSPRPASTFTSPFLTQSQFGPSREAAELGLPDIADDPFGPSADNGQGSSGGGGGCTGGKSWGFSSRTFPSAPTTTPPASFAVVCGRSSENNTAPPQPRPTI